MSGRVKKILLLVLAAALLFGTSRVQTSMNRDRDTLGLTHVSQPLENAPPMLAFTTVALGGFRGLISNMLWIRASDLQDEDKFFEMVQLSDWITKLEPHFSQVWVHEAWNMAFNISVKFKGSDGEYPDRWRWVRRGIELLRDEGLRYNPDDVLIHRELAWMFQFKLGANLDDASSYYKREWANEMTAVFKQERPDFDELIHPQTPDQAERASILKDKFKMDPAFMKKLDEEYGPLEWRLPEAHAIYWAAQGLEDARKHPNKVNQDDLIQLRRVIYQSMQLSFQRGRLEPNPFSSFPDYGPNLDIIPRVVAAYEQAMIDDPKNRDVIEKAHRNLLRQVVYTLYINNRITGPGTNNAAYWFKYLGDKYPDKPIIDDRPDSLPRNLTLDQYAFACVQIDINETSRDRVRAAIEGLLINYCRSLVLGQQDRAAGLMLLANKIWQAYRNTIPDDRWPAIGLPTVREIRDTLLTEMLQPDSGIPPAAQAILRAETGFEPPTTSPSTNSIPPAGANQ